jgi:hypothetical protein
MERQGMQMWSSEEAVDHTLCMRYGLIFGSTDIILGDFLYDIKLKISDVSF